MNAVIDTNLLVRMASAGSHDPLFFAWRERRFDICLSRSLFRELEDVLARSKMKRFVRPASAARFLRDLREDALFVEPADKAPRCRDPKDDVVLATAVSAQADFLVTADKDLYDDPELVARMRQLDIQIVLPPEFLRFLD
ncbi:MAG: putative toxin-antitoxin system toxin component, PIN family [Chloroflexi bacterium]|nr:putative toxin-antitoxin system toxin component, PIN family [Chloroflexota bacterium]